MNQPLRVDIAGVQVMSRRWGGLVGDLGGRRPSGGLPCQASSAAVTAAEADIAALEASLAARVRARSLEVGEADGRYVVNEADSAAELAAVLVRDL